MRVWRQSGAARVWCFLLLSIVPLRGTRLMLVLNKINEIIDKIKNIIDIIDVLQISCAV